MPSGPPSLRRIAPSSGGTLALLAVATVAAVFGLAFLVGWATAGSREDLRRAERARPAAAAAPLTLLARAAPFPAPPKQRARRRARPVKPRPAPTRVALPSIPVPKLLSGTG